MRDFDERLRDALIDANLLDFGAALAGAEALELSPRYYRERLRLLEDPLGWAKRRIRPVWVRAARSAACALLACTVALGALMAVSPTVRGAVLNWLREFRGDTVAYSAAPGEARSQDWRVSWLPEGWSLWDLQLGSGLNQWMFANESGRLTFTCSPPESGNTLQFGLMTDPEDKRESVLVQGRAADYYAGTGVQLLAWESAEGFLFTLTALGELERETLMEIAGSVSLRDDSAPAYEMGWEPADFIPLSANYGNGCFKQEWVRNGVGLTWRYVVGPACPFAVPEGEPEAVEVNGLPGRYWANKEEIPTPPDGQDPSIFEAGGATIIVGVGGGGDTCGTLMWEDANTAFYLSGELDKYGLLRMAESVRKKEEPVETARTGRSFMEAGTVDGEALGTPD